MRSSRRTRLISIAIGLTASIMTTCSKGRKPPDSPQTVWAPDPAHIAKIKVNRDGVILLNDETVTIESLKASLSKLSQSATSAVWYYRENPTSDPHPNAMLVTQAIIDARLPVRFSTKPDFSDSVGADGQFDHRADTS